MHARQKVTLTSAAKTLAWGLAYVTTQVQCTEHLLPSPSPQPAPALQLTSAADIIGQCSDNTVQF